jgi:hypothetical protein
MPAWATQGDPISQEEDKTEKKKKEEEEGKSHSFICVPKA